MYLAVFVLLAYAICLTPTFAQTTKIAGLINRYASVVAVDRCNNAVSVATPGGFAVGDRVLVIQMQGATIDTTNTPGFGRIIDYGNAGNYEFATIAAISGSVIKFRDNLLRTYDVAGRVQLVRVPGYHNAEVVGQLDAQHWDGSTGGVLAFEVSDTLVMNNDVNVTGTGFRRGEANESLGGCGELDYHLPFINGTPARSGEKGEGVAIALSDDYRGGRGAPANGGGAGNRNNAGGGGGSNAGVGGIGGRQWSGCGVLENGGIGGHALDSTVLVRRVFMGGGGGGGHQDNRTGTAGSNGGGIVIIRAAAIVGNDHVIVADGETHTVRAGLDGAGGSGAGGSILLDVAAVYSSLTIRADGAAGGDGAHLPDCHGPGGGGGGGLIGISSTHLSPLLTLSVQGGRSGKNLCADSAYGAGPGDVGRIVAGITLPEGQTSFQSPTANVALPFITANPGDTLTIPLSLLSRNLSFAGPGKYTAILRFNRHLLLPIGSTPKGVASGNDQLYTISGSLADTTTVLSAMKFVVLLGPTDTAPLTIVSLTWDTLFCPVDLMLSNGNLSVNTCRIGDERLVNPGAEALLRALNPNPAGSFVDISYQLIEHGLTRVSVFDTRGDEVARLLEAKQAPGDYSLRFDTAALANGTYLCILQTPTQRFSRVFQIQKF